MENFDDFTFYLQDLATFRDRRPITHFAYQFSTQKLLLPDFEDEDEAEQYRIKIRYDDYLDNRLIQSIIHESIHKTLDNICDKETSLKLDNIDKDKTETSYIISGE